MAGEGGRIRVFVKSDDVKKPYERVATSDDLFPAQEHYRDTAVQQMVFKDIDI